MDTSAICYGALTYRLGNHIDSYLAPKNLKKKLSGLNLYNKQQHFHLKNMYDFQFNFYHTCVCVSVQYTDKTPPMHFRACCQQDRKNNGF